MGVRIKSVVNETRFDNLSILRWAKVRDGWSEAVKDVADKRPSADAPVRLILHAGVCVGILSQQQLQENNPERIDVRRESANPRREVLGSRSILLSPHR